MQHPYRDAEGNHKIEGELSGWIFSDAVTHYDCPRCLQTKGYHCTYPSGRAAWPPHTERVRQLTAEVINNASSNAPSA